MSKFKLNGKRKKISEHRNSRGKRRKTSTLPLDPLIIACGYMLHSSSFERFSRFSYISKSTSILHKTLWWWRILFTQKKSERKNEIGVVCTVYANARASIDWVGFVFNKQTFFFPTFYSLSATYSIQLIWILRIKAVFISSINFKRDTFEHTYLKFTQKHLSFRQNDDFWIDDDNKL